MAYVFRFPRFVFFSIKNIRAALTLSSSFSSHLISLCFFFSLFSLFFFFTPICEIVDSKFQHKCPHYASVCCAVYVNIKPFHLSDSSLLSGFHHYILFPSFIKKKKRKKKKGIIHLPTRAGLYCRLQCTSSTQCCQPLGWSRSSPARGRCS